MRIFKENAYDIVRLYVNQLGIMIFSLLLYTAVGSLENESLSNSLSIFVSVFSICFYLVLIYYAMWEMGAKDKIRVDGGRMEPCKTKGLVMGLFANVPNFVISGLTVLLMSLFLATNNDGLYAGFLIFNTITRLHEAMFLGVINAIAPAGLTALGIDYIKFLIAAVLFTVLPLISVGVTHLAYSLGYREKKIFSFLGGKK